METLNIQWLKAQKEHTNYPEVKIHTRKIPVSLARRTIWEWSARALPKTVFENRQSSFCDGRVPFDRDLDYDLNGRQNRDPFYYDPSCYGRPILGLPFSSDPFLNGHLCRDSF